MRLRHESSLFKDLTLYDAEQRLRSDLSEMVHKIKDDYSKEKEEFQTEMEGFQALFKRYLYNTECEIDWGKIESISNELIQSYYRLEDFDSKDNINSYLDKLVVVKLNGGLGTSMGCSGPKSVIQVRDNQTFLDLTIQQIENLNDQHGCFIPLVLMNSFNTFEDTNKVIKKYEKINVQISSFLQSTYPRLNRESLLPLTNQPYKSLNGKTHISEDDVPNSNEAWYPPGHGDFYRSFVNSGLAEKFLAEGKEWIFLSNIDNLGAEVDTKILKYVVDSNQGDKQMHFLMEVTDKTRADIKGGTLIKYGDSLRLLEIAQVPKDRVDDFVSVRKFKIFNTNNLWINLRALIDIVKTGKMQMEIIKNPKTMEDGTNTIQLEEAAGAAIKNFKGGAGINVPRSRFLPVKTTSDLLLVMSNLYELHRGSLRMSEKRNFQTVPLVKLGKDFKKIKDFLTRFESIPDLLELDQLTVSGNVYFGKGLQLKGSVIVIANPGEFINLPSGSYLENKIVSGNLRILDH